MLLVAKMNAQPIIPLTMSALFHSSIVIKTIDFDNKINVTTLKLDNHYWPFYEVKYDHGQWRKINHLISN